MTCSLRLLVVLAFPLGTTALAAHADTFTYSYYVYPGDGFTITSPTLITSPADFTGPTSCVVPLPSPFVCRDVHIDPVIGRVTWQGVHAITQSYFDSFFTAPTNFLAPGNYAVTNPFYDVAGTPFSIVDNATSVTPEPSSVILLATGIFGMAGVMRRRYFTA